MTRIKKAVVPAAGLGTRFLPLTRSIPKEMLPVVHKPVIQYVIEKALDSGIEDILIITGKGKRSIEDYFDKIDAKINNKYSDVVDDLLSKVNIFYIRQKEINGLGNAVLNAEAFVDNEPFALLLGDTITKPPCIKELNSVYARFKTPVVAIEKVAMSRVIHYGVISGEKIDSNTYAVKDFIEKPTIEEAPSNLAILGEYILTPEIFECIKHTKPGKNNEIQLTDALRILVTRQEIYAHLYEGRRFDIGNKTDWLKANIELGLKDAELGDEIREFIKGLKLN